MTYLQNILAQRRFCHMSQNTILKTTLAQTAFWGPHDDARILKSTFSADLSYLEIDCSADIQIGWLNYLEIDL